MMGSVSRVTSTSAATLLLLAAACGGDSNSRTQTQLKTPAGSDPPTDAIVEVSAEDYSPSRFSDPTTVDHRWLPLEPGTKLEYVGSSLEDGERLSHGVTIIVTDLTKVIDGVETRVVWERDFTEGELVEAELAMFAQDDDGNVWHLGQYPEEYEEGERVASPTWIHGIKGASAGVTLQAEPKLGTKDYAMGYAPPPLNWVDRGLVYKVGDSTCVPAGCYEDVLVIQEFETGLPDAYQDKYYAPGVGVVRVGWRGSKDDSKEVLKLVRASTLTDAELASARTQALKLEESAYQVSNNVYALTERAQGPST